MREWALRKPHGNLKGWVVRIGDYLICQPMGWSSLSRIDHPFWDWSSLSGVGHLFWDRSSLSGVSHPFQDWPSLLRAGHPFWDWSFLSGVGHPFRGWSSILGTPILISQKLSSSNTMTVIGLVVCWSVYGGGSPTNLQFWVVGFYFIFLFFYFLWVFLTVASLWVWLWVFGSDRFSWVMQWTWDWACDFSGFWLSSIKLLFLLERHPSQIHLVEFWVANNDENELVDGKENEIDIFLSMWWNGFQCSSFIFLIFWWIVGWEWVFPCNKKFDKS